MEIKEITRRYFLQVLRDFVHSQKSQPPDCALDWNYLEYLGQIHGLGGILFVQCKNIEPDSVEIFKHLNGLREQFLSSVQQSICQQADFLNLEEAFNCEKIPFIPIKGQILRDYYPVPELRTMGDTDLLILSRDRQKTHKLMKRLGYQAKVDNHAVWTYQCRFLLYEIHDHILYESLVNHLDYQSYFDHVWDCAKQIPENSRYDISPEFHFLYLAAHTAKHMINQGNGFRPFLDMVFFVQRYKQQIDWKWIAAQLEQLKLLNFVQKCFALCERWFDVEMPIPHCNPGEKFYLEATRKTFQDGLFGAKNAENRIGVSAKVIRRSRFPYLPTALGMTVRKLFPPYRDMQLIPWYSFVDGRPYLLPAAWLYRFYYCARNKFRHSKKLLAEPYVRRKAIEERERLISDWGL